MWQPWSPPPRQPPVAPPQKLPPPPKVEVEESTVGEVEAQEVQETQETPETHEVTPAVAVQEQPEALEVAEQVAPEMTAKEASPPVESSEPQDGTVGQMRAMLSPAAQQAPSTGTSQQAVLQPSSLRLGTRLWRAPITECEANDIVVSAIVPEHSSRRDEQTLNAAREFLRKQGYERQDRALFYFWLAGR
jgi:hypothetical protein